MGAVGVAFCSSFVLAVNVVLLKFCVDRSTPLTASFMVTATGLVLFLGLSLWRLPLEMFQTKAFLVFAAAGIFMPFLGRWTISLGLRKVGPSLTSSMNSTAPALATVLAAAWLGEKVDLTTVLCIGVIILGIIIISHSGHDSEKHPGSFRTRDLLFPFLSTICSAMTFFLRKMGLNLVDSPLLGVTGSYISSTLAYGLVFALSPRTRLELRVRKKDLPLFIWAGLSLALAWLLTYHALSLCNVSLVSSILGIHPVFVLGLSFLVLRKKEVVTGWSLAGILVVALGVALLILN